MYVFWALRGVIYNRGNYISYGRKGNGDHAIITLALRKEGGRGSTKLQTNADNREVYRVRTFEQISFFVFSHKMVRFTRGRGQKLDHSMQTK